MKKLILTMIILLTCSTTAFATQFAKTHEEWIAREDGRVVSHEEKLTSTEIPDQMTREEVRKIVKNECAPLKREIKRLKKEQKETKRRLDGHEASIGGLSVAVYHLKETVDDAIKSVCSSLTTLDADEKGIEKKVKRVDDQAYYATEVGGWAIFLGIMGMIIGLIAIFKKKKE